MTVTVLKSTATQVTFRGRFSSEPDLNGSVKNAVFRFGTRIAFDYPKPVLHYQSGTGPTYCFFSDVIAG